MTHSGQHKLPDGVTLEAIVTTLQQQLGWEAMAAAVPVRCFMLDPSIASSLKFLRRTPWARAKVEALYVDITGAAGERPG